MSIRVGDVLRGRFEIQQPLGPGGDKNVYLAHDRKFDCQVTVDAFSDNSSITPGGLSVSAWEAQVLGRLGDHPNIARVVDQWEDDDTAILVSRYFPGGNLLDLITRSRESGNDLPVERILQISVEIARGLAHVHGRKILYLDLQPRNVLFDEQGVVHLVDFDTSVPLGQLHVSHLADRPAAVYMAPELTDGGGVDERADLYSLGATIYAMAAGRPPFAGSREEILVVRRTAPPLRLEREDLPQALRGLIFRLLSAERDERPASAMEVLERLEEIRTTRADIERLLASDESTRLEFKASLREPTERRPEDTRSSKELRRLIEREAIETLAAFLNTEGGTLIIGVKDDRAVVGIEVDYPAVTFESNDGWRLTFDDLVTRDLGGEVMNSIDLQLEPWHGRTIAVIRCSRRREPTWVGDELFVRSTASTRKLPTRRAVVWCRERWG